MITISHCVGLLTLWQECSSSFYKLFRDWCECFKTIHFAGQDFFYGLHILAKIKLVLDLWKWCSCIQTYVKPHVQWISWVTKCTYLHYHTICSRCNKILIDWYQWRTFSDVYPRGVCCPRVNITACSPATSQ